MEPLDIILVKGNGFISNSIKRATNSIYSHAAIAVDRYHLIETAWNYPLKIRHISYRLGEYDIYYYPGMTEAQRQRIREFLLNALNFPYDYIQLVSHLLNILLGWKVVNSNSRFICPEVIDRAFQAAGIDLMPDRELGILTPADLARSKLLIKLTDTKNGW